MFSPSGLYELVETLGKRGQAAGLIVGGVIGVLVGAWVAWMVCKHWMPHAWKEKCEALGEQVHNLADDRSLQQDKLDELRRDLEILERLNSQYLVQIKAAESGLDRVSGERDALQAEVAVSRERLTNSATTLAETEQRLNAHATELESLKVNARKGWTHPAEGPSVKFIPLHTRQVPIISVVNLKGGVGKTTITANLGVTLSKGHDLRVLMADLDYQGSLSSLCLSPEEMHDVRKSRRFVEDVFRSTTPDRYRAIAQCRTRLEDLDVGPAYLLATEDSLDLVESEEMAPWLLRISNDDVRFRLREALHAEAIRDDYDIILLDCPPRLSTASVNALAASDFVLIPVLPEPTSAEATPRLLNWIKKFQASFCPELAILGVVGNRFTPYSGGTTAPQQRIWNGLKEECRNVWGGNIRFFDEAIIPRFPTMPHKLAALSGGHHEAVMNDLAAVILKELPPYARRRTPAVHPVAHPSPPVLRS
jgi:cellulose biosynthesis protein BcsQ